MKKNLFILLPALFSLSACNLQPHYERPDIPVKSQWIKDGQHKNAADIEWQSFFSDATLKQLVA